MKVKVTHNIRHRGVLFELGQVASLPDETARELIEGGHAEEYPEPKRPAAVYEGGGQKTTD